MSSTWWCGLIVSSLIICSLHVPCVDSYSVRDAVEFRSALLDASTRSIVLQQPVILEPDAFVPVSVGRAVNITAASPAAYLDFGNALEPFISITAGGNLTLHGLQLVNVYPLQPLPLTQASSSMPLSAVSVSPVSAHLLLSHCVILVEGQLSNLTDALPFWAARQLANELQPPSNSALSSVQPSALTSSTQSPPPQSAGQLVSLISSHTSTPHGGSSRIQVADCVVVTNPAGCITPGRQLLAWDSSSLFGALQSVTNSPRSSSLSPEVLLLSNTSLSPMQWTAGQSSSSGSGGGGSAISNVYIGSCSTFQPGAFSTTLDFSYLPHVFVLQPGQTMQLGPGLMLLHAAPVSHIYTAGQQHNAWPYSNRSSSAQALLLLGSVDVSQGGQLVLNNVSVGVADAAGAWDALQHVTGAGGSRPSMQAAAGAAVVPGASGFTVSFWNTTLTGWSLGTGSASVPADDGMC